MKKSNNNNNEQISSSPSKEEKQNQKHSFVAKLIIQKKGNLHCTVAFYQDIADDEIEIVKILCQECTGEFSLTDLKKKNPRGKSYYGKLSENIRSLRKELDKIAGGWCRKHGDTNEIAHIAGWKGDGDLVDHKIEWGFSKIKKRGNRKRQKRWKKGDNQRRKTEEKSEKNE